MQSNMSIHITLVVIRGNRSYDEDFFSFSTRSDMTLSEFKFIFYWEWFHRMYGRFVGLTFYIPRVSYQRYEAEDNRIWNVDTGAGKENFRPISGRCKSRTLQTKVNCS